LIARKETRKTRESKRTVRRAVSPPQKERRSWFFAPSCHQRESKKKRESLVTVSVRRKRESDTGTETSLMRKRKPQIPIGDVAAGVLWTAFRMIPYKKTQLKGKGVNLRVGLQGQRRKGRGGCT